MPNNNFGQQNPKKGGDFKMRPFEIEQDGAHRGGAEYAHQLLTKTKESPSVLPFSVRIVDPHEGRAKALATTYQISGIPATAHQELAKINSVADIRVAATDDPFTQAEIVANSPRKGLLQAGILLASPQLTIGNSQIGGLVLAFGMSDTNQSNKVHDQASAIFKHIATLAGERRSSKFMSAPVLNSVQMKTARHILYDEIANDSLRFVDKKPITPRVFVIDGFSRQRFPIIAVDASHRKLRKELQGIAANEIAPYYASEPLLAVVFIDRSTPQWMYMVFTKHDRKWNVTKTHELPSLNLPALSTNQFLDRARSIQREINTELRGTVSSAPSGVMVTD